jgi:hypothetical protein
VRDFDQLKGDVVEAAGRQGAIHESRFFLL